MSYVTLIRDEFFKQVSINMEAADVLLQAMIEISRHGLPCAAKEEFANLQVNSKLKFLIADFIEISNKHTP
jgi:hypothetical protein